MLCNNIIIYWIGTEEAVVCSYPLYRLATGGWTLEAEPVRGFYLEPGKLRENL